MRGETGKKNKHQARQSGDLLTQDYETVILTQGAYKEGGKGWGRGGRIESRLSQSFIDLLALKRSLNSGRSYWARKKAKHRRFSPPEEVYERSILSLIRINFRKNKGGVYGISTS